MTVLQSVPLTINADSGRVVVLEALRCQRNINDYTGDGVDDSTVENCIAEAKRLIADVRAWRKAHRPELIRDRKK